MAEITSSPSSADIGARKVGNDHGLRFTVQDLVRSRAERASRLFAPKAPEGPVRVVSSPAWRAVP